MRIAVAGKGGTGKTSTTGALARLLARRGLAVVAIDADSAPNLALALGLSPEAAARAGTLPDGLLVGAEGEPALTRPVAEVVRQHAVGTADGVDLLVMGRAEEADVGCLSRLHATVRAIVGALPADGSAACLLDMDASPEGFTRGIARHADLLLILVEAAPASLLAARRAARLARDLGVPRVALVASKVRDERGRSAVRRLAVEEGLEVAGAVPFDEAFARAERAARGLLDVAPESPGAAALAEVADYLSRTHMTAGRVGPG